MAAYKDDGHDLASFCQQPLQVQTAHLGHLQVEHDTGCSGRGLLDEELLGRAAGLNAQVVGTQQTADRAEDTWVVVDQKNNIILHGTEPLQHGENWGAQWGRKYYRPRQAALAIVTKCRSGDISSSV